MDSSGSIYQHAIGTNIRQVGGDYYNLHVQCALAEYLRARDLALARVWFPLLAIVLAWGAWMLNQAPLMHPDLGPWPRLLGYFSAALAPVAAGIGVWGWVGFLRHSGTMRTASSDETGGAA